MLARGALTGNFKISLAMKSRLKFLKGQLIKKMINHVQNRLFITSKFDFLQFLTTFNHNRLRVKDLASEEVPFQIW